jgi:hypothetical protein
MAQPGNFNRRRIISMSLGKSSAGRAEGLEDLAPAILGAAAQLLFNPQQAMYLAIRSEQATEPILICPAPVATARSAMEESSVSPEHQICGYSGLEGVASLEIR